MPGNRRRDKRGREKSGSQDKSYKMTIIDKSMINVQEDAPSNANGTVHVIRRRNIFS